jgi:hypothetical protein
MNFYPWLDTKPQVGMHRNFFARSVFSSVPIECRARGIASAFQNGVEVLQCVKLIELDRYNYETPGRPSAEIELVYLRNGQVT